MNEIKMKAIEKAWEDIRAYVKENYNGTFVDGVQFEWKHEVYYRIEFGVTSNGEAYVARGSHGWSNNEFIGHPTKPYKYDRRLKCCRLEDVVLDWEKIKKALEYKAKKEASVFNFKV